MIKRVISGLAAASLAAAFAVPAGAYTSPDWGKYEAEIKALPPGFRTGTIPRPVFDEIQAKIAPDPNAPPSWTAIYHAGGKYLERTTYTRRQDGLYDTSHGDIYDPLMLFNIANKVGSFETARLSISDKINTSSTQNIININQRSYFFFNVAKSDGFTHDPDAYDIDVWDATCQLSFMATDTVVKHCANNTYPLYKGVGPGNVTSAVNDYSNDITYNFDRRFGVYFPAGYFDTVLDWRIGDQPWHSLSVSAGLSATQKEQARALFSRGFELFKSGDTVGAHALILSGLRIDPGNYLGWFALGEAARSAKAQGATDYDGGGAIYYQHTIDLAPDSPEAALAKAYLN